MKIYGKKFAYINNFAYLCTMIKRCSYGGIGIHKGLKIPRPLGLRVQIPLGVLTASLAQLVEHLFCTQMVEGSSPLGSSKVLLVGKPAIQDYKRNEASKARFLIVRD